MPLWIIRSRPPKFHWGTLFGTVPKMCCFRLRSGGFHIWRPRRRGVNKYHKFADTPFRFFGQRGWGGKIKNKFVDVVYGRPLSSSTAKKLSIDGSVVSSFASTIHRPSLRNLTAKTQQTQNTTNMSPSVEERKDGNGNEEAEESRRERTNRNLEKFLSLNLQSPRQLQQHQQQQQQQQQQQFQQQQQRLQVSVRPMHRVMLQAQAQQQQAAPGSSRRVRLGSIKGNHTYFSCKHPTAFS